MSTTSHIFNFSKRSKYVSLQLASALPAAVGEDFHKTATELMQSPQHLIVSCPGAAVLSSEWLSAFQFIAKQLKLSGKNICFIHADSEMKDFLSNPPSGTALTTFASLDEALTSFLTTNNTADKMNYIKVFVACTLRTLFIQMQLQCTQGKIFMIEQNNPDKLMGEVSGIILVESDKFSYAVLISFKEQTYLQLMSKWMGETFTELTDEIIDGAAELMNIIYGQAKLVLNNRKAGVIPSIPFIAKGRQIAEAETNEKLQKARLHLLSGKTVVVPFDSPAGSFFVQICFPEESVEKLIAG